MRLTTLSWLSVFVVGCVGDPPTLPDGGGGGFDSATADTATTDTGSGDSNMGMPCDGGLTCNGKCTPVDTDPTNCGRCMHDCGQGASCMKGVCQPVLVTSMAMGAKGLATEASADNPMTTATHVFWATPGVGVFQENVAGGNRIQISMSAAMTTNDVVVKNSAVYWTTYNAGNGTLIPLKGTVGVAMTQTPLGNTTGVTTQTGLILDPPGTNLYGIYTTSNNGMGVFKDVVGSGTVTKPYQTTGAPAINLATDGTSIFLADQNSGVINKVDIASGNVAPLIPAMAGTPNLVRVDGTKFYWCNSGTKTIWRADLPAGSNKMQIANSGATAADGLAADAVNVYWTNSAAGTLSYAPIGGGGNTTVYAMQTASNSPMRLVRDMQSLFWINGTSIWRVALP